jgi:hypothetical protein
MKRSKEMKRNFVILFLIVALSLMPNEIVHAIVYDFTATIYNLDGIGNNVNLPISIYDTISGTFEYNYDPDAVIESKNYYGTHYIIDPYSIRYAVSFGYFNLVGSGAPYITISTGSDSSFWMLDEVPSFKCDHIISNNIYDTWDTVGFLFMDSTGNALRDQSLPFIMNLTQFDYREVNGTIYEINNSTYTFNFNATIDSVNPVHPVPEPATFTFIASGLLTLVFMKKIQR